MRKVKYYILCLITALTISQTHGQKLDSLRLDGLYKRLADLQNDTTKVLLLNEISLSYRESNKSFSNFYANQIFEISKKIKYEKGTAIYHHLKGLFANDISNYDTAIFHLNKALFFYSQKNNYLKIAQLYKSIGISYYFKSDYSSAINYYLKSVDNYKIINDKKGISDNYINIGIVFKNLGEFDSSFTYYYNSAKLKSEMGDQKGIALNYNNIANLIIPLKKYDEALDYLNKALIINKKIKHIRGMGYNYENLGVINFHQGNYEQAKEFYNKAFEIYSSFEIKYSKSDILKYQGQLEHIQENCSNALGYFQQSLDVKRDIGSKVGESQVLMFVAQCLIDIGDDNSALTHAENSLEIAQTIGSKFETKEALDFLYKYHSSKGNFKEAYHYLSSFDLYLDSLFDESKVLNMTKVETKYSLNQINKENDILQKEHAIQLIEIEKKQLQIKNHNTILTALVVCIILSILSALFYYKYTQRKHTTISVLRKLNDEIKHQKKEIVLQTEKLQVAHIEVNKINASLGISVEERSTKIESQNKKLQEYSYTNAHDVKEPLSEILKIINALDWDSVNEKERLNILNEIKTPAEKLDSIIRSLNDILKEETL